MYCQEGSGEGERKAGHGRGRAEQGGYTQSGQRERRREITSSRLIACCGCVSQLEELMLLEVSELEAGRETMAEMIGQVNEVVSGRRASLSLRLPSAAALPLSCQTLSGARRPGISPAGPFCCAGESGDLDDRRHSDPGHRRAVSWPC